MPILEPASVGDRPCEASAANVLDMSIIPLCHFDFCEFDYISARLLSYVNVDFEHNSINIALEGIKIEQAGPAP